MSLFCQFLSCNISLTSTDNAQLARIYLHAWQVTGNEFFRTITEEILDYVVREMTYVGAGANDQQLRRAPKLQSNAEGIAFYSTQDADSEGVEGKFFVWTGDDVRDVLGKEAEAFIAAYGVKPGGNWEGQNILEFVGHMGQREELAAARRKLFAAREERVRPGRDDKVLTSWNGLMLAAFAEAARTLGRDDYRRVAERNADFLLRELRREDGRLLHSWKNGEAKFNGYLEDYANLIEGLLELYQTTFEPRWYAAARELAEVMIEHFGAPDGGFFDTSDDHEALIVRPRELQDNAVPSGNAMAALVLLRLAGLAVEPRVLDVALHSLGAMQPMMARYPLGFGQWLTALDYALAHPRDVAIVGDPQAADTRALLQICRTGYRPHQIVALAAPGAEPSAVPLLRDRGQIEGQATAYVCLDFTCRRPVTDPEALQTHLEQET